MCYSRFGVVFYYRQPTTTILIHEVGKMEAAKTFSCYLMIDFLLLNVSTAILAPLIIQIRRLLN